MSRASRLDSSPSGVWELIGALGAVGADPASASTPGVATSAFTSTNATSGNTVEAFLRQPDGSLIANGTYSTGGLGSGIGGSQGSVTLTSSGCSLDVVEWGSNQISDSPSRPPVASR